MFSPPPSIRIIGSLNADLTTTTPRFPKAGETLTATSFSTNPGGKGANQAVACARLSRPKPSSSSSSATARENSGISVSMVGAVGTQDYYFSTLLKPVLTHCGIYVSDIIPVPQCSTGVAVIIVDASAGGENRILLTPGANHAGMRIGGPFDILARALRDPLPDVMVLQAEIPLESVVEILRLVRGGAGAGGGVVDVVFNPAPVPPEGFPEEVFDGLAHLIVNETEAAQLTLGKRTLDVEKEMASRDAVDYESLPGYFHNLGVRNVIITLGAKGVLTSSSDREEKTFTPAEKVEKVVDTTAAGDTFVGAYAVQVARWKAGRRSGHKDDFDVNRAVGIANQAAAACVQRSGAMESVPWEDEVG